MPRQLANRPRAHPPPHTLSRLPHAGVAEYPVLPTVSRGCPGAGGRLPTCYSAVRHSIRAPKGALTVRLACVRRAASVHPEPGSNSPFKCLQARRAWRNSSLRAVPAGERHVVQLGSLGTRNSTGVVLHSTQFIKNLSYSLSWLSALSGRGIRFSRFAAGVPGSVPRRRARS